jgi:hypothetical protein
VLTGAFSTNLDTATPWLVALSIGVIVVDFLTSVIAFSKFRLAHGLFGIVVWPIGLWGACRLAKPNSPWAKRYYGERNPDKQARSEARYGHRRIDRFKERMRDAIGGRPTALIEPAADRAARDAERDKA